MRQFCAAHNGDKFSPDHCIRGSNGSCRGGEWEHEIKGNVPKLRKARGPLAPLLTKKLKRKLNPIFQARVRRTSVPVCMKGSRIARGAGRGEVRAVY
jgi:inorganic triphosphatase YgiF